MPSLKTREGLKQLTGKREDLSKHSLEAILPPSILTVHTIPQPRAYLLNAQSTWRQPFKILRTLLESEPTLTLFYDGPIKAL